MKAIGREDLFNDPRMVDRPTRGQEPRGRGWGHHRMDVEAHQAGGDPNHRRRRRSLRRRHDHARAAERPDLHARGMMQTIEHPIRGPVTVPGWPLRMSDTKVALKCAPVLGADCEGDLWRVARLLARRGQGHAASQG